MAVTSGFFNSVNHDRLYDAEQLSSIFDGIITDGVYENFGDGLRTTAVESADNMVSVGTGRAWFDHTWTLNDTPLTIAIEPANEMVNRIDAIVIDVDRRKDVRENSIIYLKGPVAEGEAKPPTFLDEDLHKQYPICYINRPPGATGPMNQSEIEYAVGTDKCPVITGILEAQNLDALWQQLDAEFNEWWDTIRDLIGGEDPVLNLQTQIDELREYVEGKLDGPNATVGLLEKSVYDLFISGNYNLKYQTYNIPNKIGNATVTASSLLPDGRVFVAGGYGEQREDSLTGNTFNDGVFVYGIYSKDGVLENSQQQKWEYKAPERGQNHYPNNRGEWQTFSANVFPIHAVMLGSTNFETFPSVFYASVMESYYKKTCTQYNPTYYNRAWLHGIGLNKVTISSDGVMSYSKTDRIYTDYTSTMADESLSYNVNLNERTPTKSGSDIIAFAGSWYGQGDSAKDKPGIIYKVNSDGVLSAPKMYDSDSPFFQPAKGGRGYNARIYGGEGKAYYGRWDQLSGSVGSFDTSELVEIDETTLNAIYITSAPSVDTNWYNKYPVYSYSLNEASGVSRKTRAVGAISTQAPTSEIYRKYYTGATNSGDGLPEGDFIAYEDENGVLVGIGPNSTQIAIGKNGGAAILKAKASTSAPSLDITGTDTKFRGYVNTGDYVYYKNGLTVYKFGRG